MSARGITEKQQAVANLIAAGMTPRQIAAAMNISVQAVHDHIAALRRKGIAIELSGKPAAGASA